MDAHSLITMGIRKEVLPFLILRGADIFDDDVRWLLYYVLYHDDRVSLRRKYLRRHMQMVSLTEYKNLMHLQVADAKAHELFPIVEERIEVYGRS